MSYMEHVYCFDTFPQVLDGGNTEQWAGQRAGLQHEIIQYGRDVFPAVPSPAAPAMPSR